METSSCYRQALKLLANREYSVSGLASSLRLKGHPHEVIKEVLISLCRESYLREDRYKEFKIRQLLKKHYAPAYIQQCLQRENISVTVLEIQGMMSEIGMTVEEQIRHLVKKKSAVLRPSTLNKKEKIMRYLVGRGHDYGQVKSIVVEDDR